MNWMDKLERKWGRHAVANLSRYFVLAQVIGYVVQLTAPGLMSYMNFDMGSILHGQIWRVVTWIFTPTASLDVFGILFLFCVLMWGSSLESMLGTFRMNVFLWGSVILCDIVGAIVYVVTRILLGYGFSPYLSTYYILMSMLLALAMCMPEGEVRLYFVLPIRMKWMLIFELVYLGYQVVRIFSIGFKLRTDCGSGTQYVLVFPCNEDPFVRKTKETPERIPGTVQSASSGVRHCTSQMCHLWKNRADKSGITVPLLQQMRGKS